MGAQQSSNEHPNIPNGAAVKICYYELLGVDRQATDDEIKKAYRKKALELHPDRNYGNVENATAKFSEVQSAYEVLSDPQERAWYDSHRESILRGTEDTADGQFEHDAHLTSSLDIANLIGRFSSRVPFTDAPNGFYGILRQTFATLAKEEYVACDWEGLEPVQYPDFGGASDSFGDVVKPFYKTWINFTTNKTFSWRDIYRSTDAPDRATRRLLEKENKKLRDEGTKEFNDAVRHLVTFVRKRDPRYIQNLQSEADRQKVLRDVSNAQSARARAENQARLDLYVVPEWANSAEADERDIFSASEESEEEQIECVVCRKNFKSEKQYEAHEKSKKHIKAVQHLQREMRKDNQLFDLDDPSENGLSTPADGPRAFETLPVAIEQEGESVRGVHEIGIDVHQGSNSGVPRETGNESLSEKASSDDEYAPRPEVESRLKGGLFINTLPADVDDLTTATAAITVASGDGGSTTHQKLGMAKEKRAKKATRQRISSQEDQGLQCAACQESFPSKTKLFNHIKKLNHAQPVPETGKGKNKKR
ncbi:hypothetical protein B7494_g7080 [Chlorociboria aeruginascens]|nr:hypothetical protein B7494_g7080 [Chlorociboria aeruginascens]